MTPKDDIIRRLMLEHREHQTVYDDDRRRKALFREAADEIERLRKALEVYAEGDWNENYPGGINIPDPEYNILDTGETARAALYHGSVSAPTPEVPENGS